MTDEMTPDELRVIRIEILDLTQKELATNLGCSTALVKKQEGGGAPILPKWAEKLRALDPLLVVREANSMPTRGRPLGGANRPRGQGNGAWEDDWFIAARPEIAT